MKRYETRRKKLSQEEKQKIVRAHNLVGAYFNAFDDKREKWFCTPNPYLDNDTPHQAIKKGKIDKLLRLIEAAVSKKNPPPNQ